MTGSRVKFNAVHRSLVQNPISKVHISDLSRDKLSVCKHGGDSTMWLSADWLKLEKTTRTTNILKVKSARGVARRV